jgi:hypothetical protein
VTTHPERDSARATELVAWLERRAEQAPASLSPRMAEAVRSVSESSRDSLVELSSRAGERLLTLLLAQGCGPRSAAPELLAADALVTYAFEAAAEDPSQTARDIEASAARAMARIAALGSSE